MHIWRIDCAELYTRHTVGKGVDDDISELLVRDFVLVEIITYHRALSRRQHDQYRWVKTE